MRRFLIDFIYVLSRVPHCYLKKEGVTTHAPHRHWYALNERFRHAQRGVLQKLSFN